MSALSGSTGTGAVLYGRSGASSAMNAVRHSPSTFIATLPFSNALEGENSSPRPDWNLTHAGSEPSVDLPASSTHLPPNIGPKLAGVFEYQFMTGLNPTTSSVPSGFLAVSF